MDGGAAFDRDKILFCGGPGSRSIIGTYAWEGTVDFFVGRPRIHAHNASTSTRQHGRREEDTPSALRSLPLQTSTSAGDCPWPDDYLSGIVEGTTSVLSMYCERGKDISSAPLTQLSERAALVMAERPDFYAHQFE